LRRWIDPQKRLQPPIFAYLPHAFDAVITDLSKEVGHIQLWRNAVFLHAIVEKNRGKHSIQAIEIQTLRGKERIQARWFIDATADIALARSAGCLWTIGRESQEEYEEPSAPPRKEFRLNGWTLCFLIRPGQDQFTGKPGPGPESDWAHIGELPDGSYYVNLCFQLAGEVGQSMGKEQAREYLVGNIFKRWPRVREAYGLEGYGIYRFAPRIGVREGPRLVGRYVLTENDLLKGGFGQHHSDCIAFCDHAMDSHLPGEGCKELPNGPFGVPFRCLQPLHVENLLIASRGASFSSLAASACRLQRTMMELGEAAGYYVATGKISVIKRPPYQGWQQI